MNYKSVTGKNWLFKKYDINYAKKVSETFHFSEFLSKIISIKKIKFITDGDVLGVISVADPNSDIDIYFGIGGGPEGVLAAAALSCLDCQMQTRLSFQNDDEKNRSKNMGIEDLNQKYNINDIVKGDVIFCATGVTDGDLVKGIKDCGDSFEAETYVLHKSSNTNKIIKNNIKK